MPGESGRSACAGRPGAPSAASHVRFLGAEIGGALRRLEEPYGSIGAAELRIAPLTLGPLHIEIFLPLDGDEVLQRLRVEPELAGQSPSPFLGREVKRLRALAG